MLHRTSRPHIAYRSLLAFLLLALAALPAQAAPAGPDAPEAITFYKIYVTGVWDNKFTVTWSTDAPADGVVDWGTTTGLGNTTADLVSNTRDHYVTVPYGDAVLEASTTYYFRVRSGGVTDDNMGDFYKVTTGPATGTPAPGRIIWGYVYQPGGTIPAADAIVYLQLQDANSSGSAGASQWVATRADSAGVWSYSLNNIRTASSGGFFSFTDGVDKLHLIARGGSQGAAESTMTTPGLYVAQIADLVLGTPATPQAPAPTVTLVSGTTNLQLTWTHLAPDADYEVWRSAQPYFLPKQAGTHRRSDQTAPYPGTTLTFTDNSVADNPSANWYYVVRGYGLGGQVAADSAAKGVFNFALQPGSQ